MLDFRLKQRQIMYRPVAQVEGQARRIGVDELKRAMRKSPYLRRRLLRYIRATLIQAAQAAVCGLRHTVEQRLARWLLLAHDRLPGEQLPLTHVQISRLLGVRRATVTGSLGMLEQDRGIRRDTEQSW